MGVASRRGGPPGLGYVDHAMSSDAAQLEKLLQEMIEAQRRRLLELAARIMPGVTGDDLFQPHDHPAIAANPDYNFEDGILAGYLAVRAALRASR